MSIRDRLHFINAYASLAAEAVRVHRSIAGTPIWIRGSAQTNLQAGSISRIARPPAMAAFTRCRLNHPRLFGPTREIADLNSPCEKGDLVDGTQQRRLISNRRGPPSEDQIGAAQKRLFHLSKFGRRILERGEFVHAIIDA